jgi:hypothetical protein
VNRITTTALLALVAAACGGGGSEVEGSSTTLRVRPAESTPTSADRTTTSIIREEAILPPELASVTSAWETDFSVRSIELDELLIGIPARDPRDAIPPLDQPAFETIQSADEWLSDQEPGVVVTLDGEARFYPLSILTRHEIVNDRFGDRSVVITYCPLCNTALAFDPTVEGDVLRFGVSGLLRNSDLVMWDDVTQSLWQQITGEAIVGELTGTTLATVSSLIVRWADFRDGNPFGDVLSQNTGFGIRYGANPYVGYTSRSAPYATFFRGEIDDRFPALERVVGVSVEGGDKAYPFSLLSQVGVANDTIGGQAVTVWWGAADTADALDSVDVATGQAVGTGVAYVATLDGRVLEFEPAGAELFTDLQTGSVWTILGRAIEGPLAGRQLQIAAHRNEFWFAWQAFFSGAPVWGG